VQGTARSTSIYLADDHVVVRRGLRLLMESVPGFEVVGEAGDAREALAALGGAVDVLLLDLNMPGEPLGALSEAAGKGVAVIVLTMERDPAFAERALQAGARGYVLKGAVDEELIDAVREVAAGGTHVSGEVARDLERRAEPAEGGPWELTARELEVLRMIARGHTNVEIAEQLSLSVRTVETHRTHIQQKLGTSGRPDLVRYALSRDLI
jgi:two-component system response regulator NreC